MKREAHENERLHIMINKKFKKRNGILQDSTPLEVIMVKPVGHSRTITVD